MKNFLIALLIFFVWSAFGLWLYSLLTIPFDANIPDSLSHTTNTETAITNTLEEKNTVIDTSLQKNNQNTITVTIANDTKVYDAKETVLFTLKKGISATVDRAELSFPENSERFFINLASYLEKNQATELHISSYYHLSESVEIPNLAEQRGELVAEKLHNLDIDKKRIVIISKLDTAPLKANNTLQQKISFQFFPLNEDRINSIKPTIPEKVIFYPTFEYGNLRATKNLKELSQNIKKNFEENPDLIIDIVGHTDNIGDGTENYKVGLEQSRQIKWFLTTKEGINRNRIHAISKGEIEPIYKNGTLSNRKKNFRIEIIYREATD